MLRTKPKLHQMMLLLMFLPVLIFGQEHDLLVPPFTGPESPYLNDFIAGDTTVTGDRVDMDRVYVLERGGEYYVNYRVEVDGFDVRVKAQDGEGTRPVIYMTMNLTSATYPGEHFRIIGEGGNLWLKDLIMAGFYQDAPEEVSNIPSGLIRVDVGGFDIVIDGCLLAENRGQMIRTEGACRVIKVMNSMMTNNGDLGRSNLGAGKGIDLRATSCDTLLFVNNTLVNFLDRVIRHRASTGALNHLIFDHNNIINSFSYHGTLALGWVGEEVQITNNLFYDAFIAGNDSDAVRQSEFDEAGELDPYGGGRMTWIFTVPNDTTNFKISNNYFTVSPQVKSFYDGITDPAHTGVGDPLTWHINGKLGADSATAFTEEDIVLPNTVEPMVNLGEWYRLPFDQGGAGKTKRTDNFDRAQHDFDRQTWHYFDNTMDCAYANTFAAYTGSQGGFPVGDLNWFPSKKAEWETWLTDIDDPNTEVKVASDFKLAQNYPNPFNPTTQIDFSLNTYGKVKLEIFNIQGKKVSTLLDKNMFSGKHSVKWDAAGFATGIYYYKLTFGSVSKTNKMLLVR